jgi:hypothetical protein
MSLIDTHFIRADYSVTTDTLFNLHFNLSACYTPELALSALVSHNIIHS